MLPLDTIVAFAAVATLLAWVPGPDNLFVLIQSALYGRMVGVFVTLALCTGLIVHTVAVAIGVAAIFQTSQGAFNALKIIGAAYLILELNGRGGRVDRQWRSGRGCRRTQSPRRRRTTP
ncbi:LysE family transporter [Mesorhizobium abyssinicae]|uniref:LysE family transporter n=1 Tax=Mesorhizobium abyssinicae TaxID=1209958 RepID=A0ABU5ANF6_9HYPH|nr:LysE family transporter [Mesorhizobium abyssinicae]MDX8538803.1 LysE family transporter [Mesorhizobium abyssinicae]